MGSREGLDQFANREAIQHVLGLTGILPQILRQVGHMGNLREQIQGTAN